MEDVELEKRPGRGAIPIGRRDSTTDDLDAAAELGARLDQLAWRSIHRMQHFASCQADSAARHRHRIKMLEAGWQV